MTSERSDRWAAVDKYEAYMGRWSRELARAFVRWLAPAPGSNWLELGCGTGALTAAICELSEPASLVACDPSEPFVAYARANSPKFCTFAVAAAGSALPRREGGYDVIASSLVLTFIPEPDQALAALRERARPGGLMAACIWDYSGGLELLHHFWQEAVALEPSAAELDEANRFRFWQKTALGASFEAAGFRDVRTDTLEIATHFADFSDYWRPFLGGTGPAPSYVASLDEPRREALRASLERRLPTTADGRIHLRARAFAVSGVRRDDA